MKLDGVNFCQPFFDKIVSKVSASIK